MPRGYGRLWACCGLYGGVLGVVGTILFLLADRLAIWWVEDATAALPLRIFAVFLPITVEWSVLAGYFTAAGRITELVGLEFLSAWAPLLWWCWGLLLRKKGPLYNDFSWGRPLQRS